MKTYLHIAIAFIFVSFFQIVAINQVDKDLFDTINTGFQRNTIFNVAFDIMRFVNNEGANPNAKNYQGEPVLSAFINVWGQLLQKYPERSREVAQAKGVILFLLANNANINALNARTNMPALVDAIRRRSLWAVKLLVNKGADLSIKDNYGKTALDIAREIAVKEMEEIEGPKEASWWSWRKAPSIEEKDITDPIYLYLKNKVNKLETKQLEEEFEEI